MASLVSALFGLTVIFGSSERDGEWHIWESIARGPCMRRWLNSENDWDYRELTQAELDDFESKDAW